MANARIILLPTVYHEIALVYFDTTHLKCSNSFAANYSGSINKLTTTEKQAALIMVSTREDQA